MKLKTLTFIPLLVGMILLAGCARTGGNHFITDATYRQTVEADFGKRVEVMGNHLFDAISPDSMSVAEYEAMQFLYAYMNTADLADYTPQYYLENVRLSFAARDSMPWGKEVPEELFRHFVLPVRVNNENLDSSRSVFYSELKARVGKLGMKEAALEVNHWCHEKVTYAPSDGRTLSPLSTMHNALGRCGEESTFTVAALRSVGIPARQVYTPRWAHTDDNHAWVEVWVDGKWHFMGACEPAADLNDAWFNSSVVRAMLIHTKVFGHYNGPEEILYTTNNYTEINVIDNYTRTDQLDVRVVNADGNPAAGASIRFCIYNYAEFNPVVTKTADAEGKSSLRIGKGDMLVWASQGGHFGYGISRAEKRETVRITLGDFDQLPEEVSFRINPPMADALPTTATPEEIEKNNERLAKEDSIRHAYESTFMTAEKSVALAKELGVDGSHLTNYMLTSRGNHTAIGELLKQSDAALQSKAMNLLSVISPKDLTDTPLATLKAILDDMPETGSEFELQYVANPRIGVELLTPYRSALAQVFDAELKEQIRTNPTRLAAWMREHIHLDSLYNSQRIICSPMGTLRAKWADMRSMEYFFVAAARSLDIPARIDPVTGKVQYALPGTMQWMDINLGEQTASSAPQSQLALTYQPTITSPNPQYYSQFTLAALTTQGEMRTLEYDWDSSLGWSDLFQSPKNVDVGDYLLISGTRMASGSVLCRMQKMRLPEGTSVRFPLILPQDDSDIQVLGSINAEQLYHDVESGVEASILSTTGRGYFALAILASGHEPSNHALKDIQLLADEFNQWGRKMLLLFPNESQYKRFRSNEFPQLPKTVVWGWDLDNANARMVAEAVHLSNTTELPIFVIADSFGRVVFVRQGYTIGLGEQMMKVIRRL